MRSYHNFLIRIICQNVMQRFHIKFLNHGNGFSTLLPKSGAVISGSLSSRSPFQ